MVHEYIPTLAIAGPATIALWANGSLWTTALNPMQNYYYCYLCHKQSSIIEKMVILP